MNDVLSVILGGGRGSRLFPLTLQRSKPAVPIAGKYRLIDIPISNCLNSDLRRMFVLTQFNSESLNKHVGLTYKFDLFSSAFVSILAAEQTEDDTNWFQGTADAVRQSLRHLQTHRWKEALILSGDQLYQMDYRKLVESHRRQVADVTVAVTPVTAEQAHAFGILKVNKQGRIVHFDEKPPRERLEGLASEVPGLGQTFLASMGIYMFGRDLLVRSVNDPALVDFPLPTTKRGVAGHRPSPRPGNNLQQLGFEHHSRPRAADRNWSAQRVARAALGIARLEMLARNLGAFQSPAGV